jgi:hypothetical protein
MQDKQALRAFISYLHFSQTPERGYTPFIGIRKSKMLTDNQVSEFVFAEAIFNDRNAL